MGIDLRGVDEGVFLMGNILFCLHLDLKNEFKHMMYYLNAAVFVEGLHREELREFFLKEAQEEMEHVKEFSDMIRNLGEYPVPGAEPDKTPFPSDPYKILEHIIQMETEVANNYAERLKQTDGMENGEIAAIHVFYEDQVSHSQNTAWELKKWIKKFPVTVVPE